MTVDKSLSLCDSLDCHIVEIDVKGPGQPSNEFSVKTIRRNPAAAGVVTGSATYGSFWSSVLRKLQLLFTLY